ncbi:MAG: glycine/sarcosine/betaine reductase component B subunit [Eubacteriales bacterium]|nr:glycine/sarcosine/betaine reductase component B subunit [Eubacteriales bacterium]
MSKRLEIDYIDITKVSFGEKTQLCGSELTINKQELISQFDTSSFDTVEIFIASPGDDVRILGLTDCTQPRVKADDPDATFPGYLGKLVPAGDGRTVALRGVLISELYPLKANFKGLLDMRGPIADISMLSRHIHIILDVRPKEGVTPAAYCQAQKLAALKVAVWLAKLGIGREPNEKKVYELTPVGPGPDGKPLPKVAYLTSQWAGFDVQQFFMYGQSGMGTLPFVIHPNEMLDGAMIYRYMNLLYYMQEEPMIRELYARHGKDIEFVGMIVTAGKTETTAKEVSSMMAAEFARDYLHADITINTKCGMGHCQLEQQMLHIWSERLGMKAVSVMPGVSSEKPGDLLVISDPRVDAVVHSGDVKTMTYPHIETLIGVHDIPALMAFDLHGPFTITTNGTVVGGNTTQGANYMTEDLDLKTTGWRMPHDD